MMTQKKSLIVSMAEKYSMEAHQFANTIKATCLPKEATDEQFAAFLMVANEHQLNPLTKEIYAFPAKGGGIQPIVGVDGWARIMNSHPQFDGIEFEDEVDEKGEIYRITAVIYRKDRSHPTRVTEYMGECKRNTDTWKNWPARMLRHKAMIQCCRIAFGFTSIIEPDEFERRQDANVIEVTPDAKVSDLNEKIKAAL